MSSPAGFRKVVPPVAGRAVLVTGAARGIGAATARELAGRGARLALVGLEPDRLAALAGDLGPAHLWVEVDVTDSAALQAAVTATVDRFGRLDAVLANAGVVNYGTVRTADPEQFTRTVQVNLIGVYRTLAAAAPALIDSRGYALVVSSIAAFTPLPGLAGYCASKAGAEAVAGAVRAELGYQGVQVGSAHPSWIDTDMVRGAERDLPSFAEMRGRLPWPARATTSVQDCAVALADGLARRSRRVYVPRSAVLLSALRSVLTSAPVEALTSRQAARLLPRMDAEVRALRS